MSLRTAIIWWPVAVVLSFAYFWFVLRHFTGKVKAEKRDGLY
jgi:hypothetical protein